MNDIPPELKGTRWMFTYGSNMSPKQVTERKLNMSLVGVGELQHYKFMHNKVSKKDPTIGFANIEPCWKQSVHGVVYDMSGTDRSIVLEYDLSPAEFKIAIDTWKNNLAILDKHEGYPEHYERLIVPVRMLEKQRPLGCMTYIATRNMSGVDLMMRPDYIQKIKDGLDEHKINENYSQEIKTIMDIWKAE
jgi:gamma-glutamylcyclotransferase